VRKYLYLTGFLETFGLVRRKLARRLLIGEYSAPLLALVTRAYLDLLDNSPIESFLARDSGRQIGFVEFFVSKYFDTLELSSLV